MKYLGKILFLFAFASLFFSCRGKVENMTIKSIAESTTLSPQQKFHAFNREITGVLGAAVSKPEDEKCLDVLKDFYESNEDNLKVIRDELMAWKDSMSPSEKSSVAFSMLYQDYTGDLYSYSMTLKERAKDNPELEKYLNELMQDGMK